MRFEQTSLEGAWLIEPSPIRDERGFFARTFCVEEYAARELESRFVQHSISHSAMRGTLRGMHFQHGDNVEVKVVTCLRGGIWDVVIDLRPGSPTFARWQGFDLNCENRRQLYIPRGFAHGFQAMADCVEVGYMMSAPHVPDAAGGFRYDDPAFAIEWPLAVTRIAKRDLEWPCFDARTN